MMRSALRFLSSLGSTQQSAERMLTLSRFLPILVASALALPQVAQAQPWRIDTVRNDFVQYPAIATSPDGIPRIAYGMFDGQIPGYTFMYDVYPWGNATRVQVRGSAAELNSVAISPTGEPLFGSVSRTAELFTVFSLSETILSPGSCSGQPTLDFDSSGNAHVVYVDGDIYCNGYGKVFYATDVSGNWETTSLTNPGNEPYESFGRYLTLDVGPNDQPRIAYIQGSAGLLRYREKTATSWIGEIVVHSSDLIGHLSLAVDDLDVPHICYSNSDTDELVYATRVSPENWVFDVISRASPGVHWFSTIAVDSGGTPHVVWYDGESSSVRYARLAGDFWVQQTLGDVNPGSGKVSIAIDAYDDIHVAFYDGDGPDDSALRYASSLDCNDNNIHDLDEIENGLVNDCNDNGHPDDCEISYGFAEDCDGNGVPDECDIDCNGNGIPDACESFSDCNANGVPDECEDDCNGNDIPDECDIDAGDEQDCNRNDIPDSCDLANGTSPDCNENGIPDECDITYGGLPDCDRNGVPDECDFASGDPVDCNENLEIDLCELPDAWETGAQEYGWFGAAVASGDFDGDGFTDIAVGQPSWSGARGRVHIYYGGDPMDTVADEVMSWNGTGDRYGQSLATGNINGDAYDDLVIGISGYMDGVGAAIVFVGTAEADLTYFDSRGGYEYNSNFGASVAVADVTGDGLGEVIVGAPSHTTNQDPGHVYVYDGTNLDGAPIETWDGYANDDDFGSSVANAGDVDGNGRDDVITGTGFSGTNSGLVGYARLFLSQQGGMVEGPTLGSGEAGDLYGYDANSAGDLNDDGFDDFVVTAPYSGVSGNRPGRAFLYFGSANPDGSPDLVFVGEEHLADLGSAVAPAGDVNGDGFADLLIGSDHLHNGGDYSWADLFFGGPHLDSEPDQRIFSDYRGFGMGYAVSGAGDTNGDGIEEVVVGHPQHSDSEFFEGRVSVVQLDLPDFGDCNLNGVFDMCDIASGTSNDDDSDGVPDECSATSVDLPGQDRLELALNAYPIPAAEQVQLTFQLPETGDVRLEVFDASGRRVASLADGAYEAGRHSLAWDRKAGGRTLAAGMYQLRLTTSGGERTRRLVLLH